MHEESTNFKKTIVIFSVFLILSIALIFFFNNKNITEKEDTSGNSSNLNNGVTVDPVFLDELEKRRNPRVVSEGSSSKEEAVSSGLFTQEEIDRLFAPNPNQN